MVVLGGDTPTAVPGLPQDIEQAPLWAAAGVEVQPVDPDDAGAAVAEAFARARAERRPIALNLPTDVQERESIAPSAAGRAIEPPPAPVLSGEALAEAAAAIERAERVVVLAGRGAIAAGAKADLVALADHAGALLATSLPANGWFTGHPFAVGIAGGFSSEVGRRLLGEADCVVAFGASLNHFTSRGGGLFSPDATIVHVDVDPQAIGRYAPVAIGVLGDAGAVARGLRERLPA
jgi:thiamine pyrophosphate-dependent acetolactate synthase large subunit-like protein